MNRMPSTLRILTMLCMLNLLTITVYAQAQPYQEKKKVDEEAEEEEPTYDVLEINSDNWKDNVIGGRHLFIIFTDLECRECRRGATQLALLANIT